MNVSESPAAPDQSNRPAPRLGPRDLLALQLVARGYTPAQIDDLLEAPGATNTSLLTARAVLGGETLAWVLAVARHRGLIL
jgi:hypothetical protein